MKNKVQGWRYALVFALTLSLSGCSGREEVYTAGMQAQELCETSQEEPDGAFGTAADQNAAESSSEPDQSVGEPSSEAENVPEGYVYVCGAVLQPGVYPMRGGMRVFEAIGLAGGFAPDADREWLNQAEPVTDGQRLYVYTKEETLAIAESRQAAGQADSPVQWAEDAGTVGASGTDGDAGAAGDSAGLTGQKVNLNTADRAQLKTLPGIGDAKADAIVRYREEHGAFGAIEEIQNISGIKSAVFSKIRDLITV